MISKEHKKHAFVAKPIGGKIHRNEIAFLGAPCGIIQQLTTSIASHLKGKMSFGYVDADHGEGGTKEIFGKMYTDKISHHQLSFDRKDLTFQFRNLFNDQEAVLVNGNHFQAEKQAIIINEKKRDSLLRKLDRLTNVKMIILDGGMAEPFDFIQAMDGMKNVPKIPIEDIESISKILLEDFHQPSLKGLVFAGGLSTRMGKDKGAIDYHGKAQREYAADLLNNYCDETFLSVQEGQQFDTNYGLIHDSFRELGPYGGLLSAFRQDPNTAWVAVACDIPLLDNETLQLLVESRDTSKMATCFHNPATEFPEPLITIWEPRAYPVLLQFLGLGYSCPRKVLINNEVHEVHLERPEVLANVNTPEEHEKVQIAKNG